MELDLFQHKLQIPLVARRHLLSPFTFGNSKINSLGWCTYLEKHIIILLLFFLYSHLKNILLDKANPNRELWKTKLLGALIHCRGITKDITLSCVAHKQRYQILVTIDFSCLIWKMAFVFQIMWSCCWLVSKEKLIFFFWILWYQLHASTISNPFKIFFGFTQIWVTLVLPCKLHLIFQESTQIFTHKFSGCKHLKYSW